MCQALSHAAAIISIAEAATAEAALRSQYEVTSARAMGLELPLIHGARDTWALGDATAASNGLDACLAALAGMLSSRLDPGNRCKQSSDDHDHSHALTSLLTRASRACPAAAGIPLRTAH